MTINFQNLWGEGGAVIKFLLMMVTFPTWYNYTIGSCNHRGNEVVTERSALLRNSEQEKKEDGTCQCCIIL